MSGVRAAIFDLDGVICTTSRCHYLAWKRLADELGIPFDEKANEALKGVSRRESLELLLRAGARTDWTEAEKQAMLDRKNGYYIGLISGLTRAALLPGVEDFVLALRAAGIKTALGSASRNAPLILEQLSIRPWFDAVADGSMVRRAKPDPEVFLLCAGKLGLPPADCVVFEDAPSGVLAAHRAGMRCIGVGSRQTLAEADLILPSFLHRTPAALLQALR